jgi:phage N-6-adenine-methyltransferase
MPSRGFTHESTYNESKEWYTPPTLFEQLNIDFDLDPCAPPKGGFRTVPAKRFITFEQNGLLTPWDTTDNVFMNPPYGLDTPAWLSKLATHAQSGGRGIALVFARTDTKWFHEIVRYSNAIAFFKGRLQFLKPDGTKGKSGAGAGSMLVVWGHDNRERVEQAFNKHRLGLVASFWG